MVVVGRVSPEDGGGAVAEHLEPVVEVLTRRESLGAEAGGGVIDLDQRERLGSAVRNGGVDVGGVTAGDGKSYGEHEDFGEAHEGQAYQAMKAAPDSVAGPAGESILGGGHPSRVGKVRSGRGDWDR